MSHETPVGPQEHEKETVHPYVQCDAPRPDDTYSDGSRNNQVERGVDDEGKEREWGAYGRCDRKEVRKLEQGWNPETRMAKERVLTRGTDRAGVRPSRTTVEESTDGVG